jgi:hypothetical protein
MKQIDFDIRVFNLTGAGTDGTQTRQFMLDYIHTNYPVSDGWEVKNAYPVDVASGAVSVLVFLVKYETTKVNTKAA